MGGLKIFFFNEISEDDKTGVYYNQKYLNKLENEWIIL